jgi:hypothetical protein
MNNVQKNYKVAKASFSAAEENLDKAEQEFLLRHGRKESHLWAIKDDDDFEKLSMLFAEENKKEHEAFNEAGNNLEKATKELVNFGLSLLPKKYADILHNCKEAAVRDQIINVVMKLDSRTVPPLGIN